MKTAAVIIPTYNEIDSIKELITYIIQNIRPKSTNWDICVLVVDGKSTDGTTETVKSLQKQYESLHLIEEYKKEGLGAAYFKGFKFAVQKLNSNAVIELDADFQHPPESILTMLKELDNGYELVLGSRKIEGGSYPKQWGFKRLFLSKFGGAVARFLLFFPGSSYFKVTDPTTGLKATLVNDKFHKLDFDNFYTKGFGYKIEMLYRLVTSGSRVKEIPLNFNLRKGGESKITNQTPGNIFRTIFYLRFSSPVFKKFLKFGVVGFTGFIINALCLELFTRSELMKSFAELFSGFKDSFFVSILANKSAWSAGFAAEISIINNFILNNVWTFSKDKIMGKRKIIKFLQFNLTSIGAIIIQFLFIGFATLIFKDSFFVRQISLILAIGCLVMPYNWLMYNKVIWKSKNK